MRQRGKVDANQAEIVKALEAIGAEVQSLASVGNGVPDLLVAYDGYWHLLEVKNGSNPASHRQLTQAEKDWHERFGKQAPIRTVCDVESAIEAVRQLSTTPR